MSSLSKYIQDNKTAPEVATLERLIAEGVVELNDEGLPMKALNTQGKTSRHFTDLELTAIIIPYMIENMAVSTNELVRQTGMNKVTINKGRRTPTYFQTLAKYTNERLVEVRGLAVDELYKLIADKNVSANVKCKAADIILRHSAEVSKVQLLSKQENKVSIEQIMKELEDM